MPRILPLRRSLEVLSLVSVVFSGTWIDAARAQSGSTQNKGWTVSRSARSRSFGSVGTPSIRNAKTVSASECVSPSGNACQRCNPNFWIVSTRGCRNGKRGLCRYDQFHYGNGRCVAQRDGAAFQRWLTPGAPVCVVVHGSFTSFRGLLGDGCLLCRWLHTPAPHRRLNIVIFTWPSDDFPTGFFPIDIVLLGRRSARHGLYLARFLQTIPVGSRISLIGHSHGARTVSSALHFQAGGTVQGRRLCHPRPCRHRYRAVLLAAAIDHHWLNPRERYGRALCGTEALLNLRNRKDLALSFYPLRKPFSHSSLARTGFTRNDRRKLGSWNAKVREWDVTSLIGHRHMWHNYFKRAEISSAIAPYVHFTDDDSRIRVQLQSPSRAGTNSTPDSQRSALFPANIASRR